VKSSREAGRPTALGRWCGVWSIDTSERPGGRWGNHDQMTKKQSSETMGMQATSGPGRGFGREGVRLSAGSRGPRQRLCRPKGISFSIRPSTRRRKPHPGVRMGRLPLGARVRGRLVSSHRAARLESESGQPLISAPRCASRGCGSCGPARGTVEYCGTSDLNWVQQHGQSDRPGKRERVAASSCGSFTDSDPDIVTSGRSQHEVPGRHGANNVGVGWGGRGGEAGAGPLSAREEPRKFSRRASVASVTSAVFARLVYMSRVMTLLFIFSLLAGCTSGAPDTILLSELLDASASPLALLIQSE